MWVGDGIFTCRAHIISICLTCDCSKVSSYIGMLLYKVSAMINQIFRVCSVLLLGAIAPFFIENVPANQQLVPLLLQKERTCNTQDNLQSIVPSCRKNLSFLSTHHANNYHMDDDNNTDCLLTPDALQIVIRSSNLHTSKRSVPELDVIRTIFIPPRG